MLGLLRTRGSKCMSNARTCMAMDLSQTMLHTTHRGSTITRNSNATIRKSSNDSKPPGLGRPPATATTTTKTTKLTAEEEAQAEKMFRELNALMEQRKQKELALSNQTSWGSSIATFVKNSKHQLINVLATFGCLVLAMQVAEARIDSRRKKERIEALEGDLTDLATRIQTLQSESFVSTVAQELEEQQRESKKGWFSSLAAMDREKLTRVLHEEIVRVMADAVVVHNDEKERNEVEQLQQLASGLAGEEQRDMLHPAAQQMVNVASVEDEEDPTVKRRRKIRW